jgi:hypothetical protein
MVCIVCVCTSLIIHSDRYFSAAGLKTMEVFEKKVITEPKQKKAKNRSRKGKITNTHLQNLDLTVDYVPRKTF